MARYYDTGPAAEELALIGITAEDIGPTPDVEVWKENSTVVEVFIAMDSQWRHGFSGPTGMDYTALPIVFDLYGVKKSERQRIFPDLKIMEGEALKLFHKK